MKKVFTLLILLSLLSPLLFAGTLSTSEAMAHLGEEATVCGKAVGGYYARGSYGQPTFINLDDPYPDQKFTIVIWGDHRDRFDMPERSYTGRDICVSGVIESYRGIPQIVVERPSQIE